MILEVVVMLIFLLLLEKDVKKRNLIGVIIKNNTIKVKIMYFLKEQLKLLKKQKKCGKILRLLMNQFLWIWLN